MSKLLEFKNVTNDKAELYFYGEFTTEKYNEDDVTTLEFRNQLKEIGKVKNINMYFDSFGGNVFVASAIVSMLKRYKEENNVTINAYVDSASASSASFLMMVADNIYLYENSMVLIHKPMISAFMVNSNDMKELINTLDTMEDNVIIPLYMKHTKEGITIDNIKEIMAKGDWLSSKEASKIFNVTILDEQKEMIARVEHDKFILDNYKNIPQQLKNKLANDKKQNTTTELELAQARLRLLTL